MILHTALFTWRDGVTSDDVDRLTAELTAMAASIPQIREYRCGPNLRLRPSPADYAVTALLDDEAGLAAYLDSDAHTSVYDRLLGDMIGERIAAQLEISDAS